MSQKLQDNRTYVNAAGISSDVMEKHISLMICMNTHLIKAECFDCDHVMSTERCNHSRICRAGEVGCK
jgi:hypothetical protein